MSALTVRPGTSCLHGGQVARIAFVLSLAGPLAGCRGGSSPTSPPDASPIDAGASMDSGSEDASTADGGPRDTGTDADAPDDASNGDADAGRSQQEGCVPDMDLGSATGLDVAVGSTDGNDDTLYPECTPVPGNSPETVFRWQAPSSGTWVFDTLGSSFDTAVHVRDLDCFLLACSDDILLINLLSRAAVDLEAGQEVYIVVDGTGGHKGEYRLNIHETGSVELVCDDGFDDDRDGRTDCADLPDCRDVGSCLESDCTDGMDNDGDFLTDCADPNCAHIEPCAEAFCSDGLDGDGDFATDCDDSDCDHTEPCGEAICDDGFDGDSNGLTDCADANCECALPCLPADPCPEIDLGSVVGASVATGETGGCPRRTPDATECAGDLGGGAGTGPETTFLWTAPAAGVFTFDTSGSGFDTTLYLLDGCDGPMLACNEDIATAILQRSRITREFAAGESVIIVIDGWGGDSGAFTLHILQAT